MASLAFESPAQWQIVERQGIERGFVHAEGVALDVAAHAVANHGRWIVRCPFCPSARMGDPAVNFWCSECGNAAVGGQEVKVDWPSRKDMEVAEEILAARPVENRNWEPREVVLGGVTLPAEELVHIAAENHDHDVAVPAPLRAAVARHVKAR